MKYVHIQKNILGFTKEINFPVISCEEFSWDERERVCFEEIKSEYDTFINNYNYCFMFYVTRLSYPINNIMKKFGIIKQISNNKKLISNTLALENITLNDQVVQYGLVQLDNQQFSIWLKNIIDSYIIFSNDIISFEDCKKYFNINNKIYDIKLSKLINDFCLSNKSILMYRDYSGGSSFYLFHKN